MPSFKDTNGREWLVTLNVAQVKRVRERLGINLADLPEIVKLEIESQALPLGRIMIRHHLLREVELLGLWRVAAGPTASRSPSAAGSTGSATSRGVPT